MEQTKTNSTPTTTAPPAPPTTAAELRQFEHRLGFLEQVANEVLAGGMHTSPPGTPRLNAALARAQGTFAPLSRTAHDKYRDRRYADLGAVLAAVRGPLAANELALTQQVRTSLDGNGMRGKVEVTSTLRHSSGETLSDVLELPVLPMPTKKGSEEEVGKGLVTPQAFGSTITYARRYSLEALLGIAAEGDEEGGGQADARRQQARQPAQPRAQAAKASSSAPTRPPVDKLSTEDLEAEISRGLKKREEAAGDMKKWPPASDQRLQALEAEKRRRFSQLTADAAA